MNITYDKATAYDVECIYQLCKQLIDGYENIESIDYEKVLKWVRNKIEASIDEYTAVYADGQKAGYYHFYKNEDGENEIDDLYIFSEYQNQGIGIIYILVVEIDVYFGYNKRKILIKLEYDEGV